MFRKILSILFAFALIVAIIAAGPLPLPAARAQSNDGNGGTEQALWAVDEEIEHNWKPDYLDLATGDPDLLSEHGVYAWPFPLDTIGWSMQSYQNYSGAPYFHHGTDMMKIYGTHVYSRSGGQVVNIENYQPGWNLYWEVAVLDPDGYIWQYHHILMESIPQNIWDAWYAFQVDPLLGHIDPDTYIGDIIYWPVDSFNHIHLNILGAEGVYVNGFEFHNALPDTDVPEIQDIGLLQNGQIYAGDTIEGDYSLYVQARDLISDTLDTNYYLPPWRISFTVDGGPEQVTWQFDNLPGGADDTAYLDDFYVVPPTCGDYGCRNYVIDLGFIKDSQFVFPWTGGEHTVLVTVSDYAGSSVSQPYTYTVIGPPPGTPVWQDDFETDKGWVPNPDGTDTATSGLWERGNPETTYSNGIKQLGTAVSEVNDLVTGRLAGGNATSYDVDGGLTSIRSPEIALPAGSNLTLSFQYYLAHGSNSSSADYLRVTVVSTDTLTVFQELGAANDDDGAWVMENVSIDSFAGQTVTLLIEAADEAGESLVEAGIDNLVIVSNDTNQAPVAEPQTVSTAEDTPLDVVLTGSDADGDPLSFSVFSNPAHGSLSGTAPNLTYTPAADYYGLDSFSFQVDDGTVKSEPATVSIEVSGVNDAPQADLQSVSTAEDTPIDILLSGSDVDGDALSFSIVATATHGTIGGLAPNLIYTPTADYYGVDSFSFVANDGQVNSAPAAVSIEVSGVNDAPLADLQTVSTPEDTALDILLSGTDPDGDMLTYTLVTTPAHGTLSGTAPDLTYTPEANYNGTDSFTFLVNDGQVSSEAAAVSIEVAAVNDAPEANPLSVLAPVDMPLPIVLSGTDVDGDALSFTVVSSPVHGTLSGTGANLTYTPEAGYVGEDSFSFVVNDGELDSATAVVSITVGYVMFVAVVFK